MSVVFLPEVREYFNNMACILYEKGYFSFEDTAQKYVEDLFDAIEMDLPIHLHKPAPKYFDKYGKDMEYAVFRKSRHTSWYVFFRIYKKGWEDVYQVRYIANNHTIAQYIIEY